MQEVAVALAALAARAVHVWTRPERLGTFTTIAVVLILWACVLRRLRGRWPTPDRDDATDAMYTAFYVGGIFGFLVGGPVYALVSHAIHAWAPALELHLLKGKPGWLQFLALTAVTDLVSYGWHRWAHASRFLWLFHRIHHAEPHLTPLTNYRFHAGDMALRGTLLAVPVVILGADASWFLAALWVETALNLLAHSDLDWGYGRAGYLLVSPRFHRIHHAAESGPARRNFGFLLAVWDHVFGTADGGAARPAAYGVQGESVPRAFFPQQIDPFGAALRQAREGGKP
jgi:sterol desaturase/sphingolipid hydroxylase (fatty acid hydroxylase superfamily)